MGKNADTGFQRRIDVFPLTLLGVLNESHGPADAAGLDLTFGARDGPWIPAARRDVRSGLFGGQQALGDLNNSFSRSLRLVAQPLERFRLGFALSRHQDSLGALDDLAILQGLAEAADFALELDDLAVSLPGKNEGGPEGFGLDRRDDVGHHRVLGGSFDELQGGVIGDDDGRQGLRDAQADEKLEGVSVGELDP